VLAAQDTRIQLHLGFQSAARLVLLLSAADLVVLPFEGGLHSGSLLLALTFGCPTLVRNTPYARDVASSVGERWIRLIPTALDTQMLRDALDWGRERTTDEGPSLEPFDWDAIGQQTCAFYAEVRAWRGLSTMPSH
jgi:glycosyltransferase involved in cell wall biosynthesis